MRQIFAFAILSAALTTVSAYDYPSARPEVGSQYFIYSLSAGSFLSDGDTLQSFPSTLWTLGEDGSLSSGHGHYISISETHEDTKRFGVTTARDYTFHASTSGQTVSVLSNLTASSEDASAYYVFGNEVEDFWERGLILPHTEKHVHYLTITPEGALCADSTEVNDDSGRWIFVTESDYASSSASRKAAIQQLGLAISNAEAVHGSIVTTTAAKAALWTQILAAKTVYSTANSFLGNTIKYDRLVETIQNLEKAVETAESLTDSYLAALDAIDRLGLMSQELAVKAIGTTAKTAVEATLTTDAIKVALTTMRATALLWLRGQDAMDPDTDITAIVGNSSFDLGDLSSWNTTGDEPAATTTVAGTEGIEGTQGRYMLDCGFENGRSTSGQLLFQPLIGLPIGQYEASAAMAADQGTLRTNSAHINAVVVPSSLFEGTDSITVKDILSKIGVILRDGKITTGSVKTADCDSLQVATCEFRINENDIVLIGMNAGLVPLTGSVPYRADNVNLMLKTFGNPTTAVDRVEAEAIPNDDILYDLCGRPVRNPGRGIYIRRGKKIIL